MKKRKCTEALVKRVGASTQICYDYAVSCAYSKHYEALTTDCGLGYSIDDFKSDLRLHGGYGFIRQLQFSVAPSNIKLIRSEVNDQYLIEVCKLATETLEEILLAHEKGKYPRASRTIETIKLELATRGLLL